MNNGYVIGEDAMQKIEAALATGNKWIVHNSASYYLGADEIDLFKSKYDAISHVATHHPENGNLKIFYASSIADVFRELPYGEGPSLQGRIDPDANGLHNNEGNPFTEALTDHFEQQNNSNNLKLRVMNEKAMSFNENQLKRSGFAEAFTPDLKKKMEDGMPVILHNFKKEYDGDRVDAALHLKKSATSDYYFLNKFDLQLQKAGQADSVKQTFYITAKKDPGSEDSTQQKVKQENRYTLKEAYNLLAGRPVHKNLFSKEGQEYEAWVKLNLKNQLDNGNYELKQYTRNYGFELENVLSKYPIKELINEQYKKSLIDSLYRGNLQKVTFIDKDGREEKLYVSPNITLGVLNVHDQNKQRLTTEKLVEKQYIGKELADEIKQRISQQQKPEQKEKQELTLTPKQEQKQKQVQKQKNDAPSKKQTNKQKVH